MTDTPMPSTLAAMASLNSLTCSAFCAGSGPIQVEFVPSCLSAASRPLSRESQKGDRPLVISLKVPPPDVGGGWVVAAPPEAEEPPPDGCPESLLQPARATASARAASPLKRGKRFVI